MIRPDLKMDSCGERRRYPPGHHRGSNRLAAGADIVDGRRRQGQSRIKRQGPGFP